MSDFDDVVRDGLRDLLANNRPETVLDPVELPPLLQPIIGAHPQPDDDLVRAVVMATRTPALRALAEHAPDASVDAVGRDLESMNLPRELAAHAAALWCAAIGEGPSVADAPAVASATTPAVLGEPFIAAGSLTPPAPLPPPTPADHSPPSWTDASVRPTEPTRPTSTKRRIGIAVMAAVAVAALVAGVLGWTRDPSKERATSAEAQAVALDSSLQDLRGRLGTAEATLAQRTTELANATAQITKMSTVTPAQILGARLPQTFALTGKVAPGSCSLTGEACNASTTVRNITLSCTGASCDCTNGSCTITSDLWKTAAPLAYDPATGLYTARGSLDADLFRCAGVAQPTTYELRLRTTAAVWNEGTWVAGPLVAELAQASSAPDCFAGNRTYALGGPAA